MTTVNRLKLYGRITGIIIVTALLLAITERVARACYGRDHELCEGIATYCTSDHCTTRVVRAVVPKAPDIGYSYGGSYVLHFTVRCLTEYDCVLDPDGLCQNTNLEVSHSNTDGEEPCGICYP